jgi:anti-anti-sigma factor
MNESTIRITKEVRPGRVTILRVEGRLDARATDVLEEQAKEVAAEGRNLLVNMKGVTFIGSSGVGLMLTLTEEFREQAGSVRFVELSPVVRAVVDLLQMMSLIGVDASEDAGLNALKAA